MQSKTFVIVLWSHGVSESEVLIVRINLG